MTDRGNIERDKLTAALDAAAKVSERRPAGFEELVRGRDALLAAFAAWRKACRDGVVVETPDDLELFKTYTKLKMRLDSRVEHARPLR